MPIARRILFRQFQVVLSALMLICVAARGDVVERRGTAPPLTGTVIAVDDNGVKIRSDATEHAVHFVPWDRVRSVQSEAAAAHNVHAYLKTAEKLWRARTRLERKDAQLAEPLFEQLFEQYRGKTHETALVVAEGLLRCRRQSGMNELAVIPALEVLRLRRAGVEIASYTSLRRTRPLFDDDSAISRALPPVWLSRRGMRKLQSDLAGYDAQGDKVVATVASLYQHAVKQQLTTGAPATQPDGQPEHNQENEHPDEDGTDQHKSNDAQNNASPRIEVPVDRPELRFMRDLIYANASDQQMRKDARSRLLAAINDRPQWMQAWTHEAVGRSLISENGLGRQQRGVVHLLHLPARYAPDQPYLAGLSLYRAVKWLEGAGHGEAVESLRDELIQRYPNHPVHHLTELRTGETLASSQSGG